jgi:hypothetical protein
MAAPAASAEGPSSSLWRPLPQVQRAQGPGGLSRCSDEETKAPFPACGAVDTVGLLQPGIASAFVLAYALLFLIPCPCALTLYTWRGFLNLSCVLSLCVRVAFWRTWLEMRWSQDNGFPAEEAAGCEVEEW